ncbi:MAG: LmeA family phospholipid-binding protein [Cyanobacteria bacterium REEB459]|nr:LmeA family phospholipid-binding protein [Cyanobacteria bacterium REEB459]
MDVLALIITTLTAILSPAGMVVDHLAEQAVRSQTTSIESIQVRIDNLPNYQILWGRVNQVKLSATGVYLRQLPDLRVERFNLESDPLDVDGAALRQGRLKLNQPAQAALQLQLKARDLNLFLASSAVQTWLNELQFSLSGFSLQREQRRYGLTHPVIEFLDGDRLRLSVDLQDHLSQVGIPITIDTGLEIVRGDRLRFINPVVKIEGIEAPSQLITSLAEGVSQEFSLRRLESLGLLLRVLSLKVNDNSLNLAVFARLEPTSPLLQKQSGE